MRIGCLGHPRLARFAACIAAMCALDVTAAVARDDDGEAAATSEAEIATSPAGARAAPAASRTRRVLFICNDPPPVVFSDRPCGPRPVLHEVRFTAPVVPPPKPVGASGSGARTVVEPRREAASRARPEDAPTDADRHAETCRRLEQAVRSLDDRMRAGYSIREAARLWARWREARERLRDADC